jgi:CoA:oxalate CoA-transferase
MHRSCTRRAGFDLAQVEYQGGGRPANTATFIADVFGGMSAFGAVQTALYDRERAGKGQFIDVALMDAMLNLLVYEVQEAQAPTDEKVRVYQPLKTLDGYIVAAPTSQKNFEQLAKTVGTPGMDDRSAVRKDARARSALVRAHESD